MPGETAPFRATRSFRDAADRSVLPVHNEQVSPVARVSRHQVVSGGMLAVAVLVRPVR